MTSVSGDAEGGSASEEGRRQLTVVRGRYNLQCGANQGGRGGEVGVAGCSHCVMAFDATDHLPPARAMQLCALFQLCHAPPHSPTRVYTSIMPFI